MKHAFAAATLALSTLSSITTALAAEPAYLDDRSSAEAVVRSLYNAINRHEYARAWDYFGDTKPAKDFNTFVQGYEGTDSVEVKTGAVSDEGAAGSIYYSVPVAIAATDKSGTSKIFAGCYTLRQVNGAIQEPPFSPIRIDKGALAPSDKSFDDAVPEACDGAPPPPKKDADLGQAKKAFLAAYGDSCDSETPDGKPIDEPTAYSIRYKDSGGGPDDPEREVKLYRFFCHLAAYNELAVYYVSDDISGVRQLQFAVPELDIRREKDDDMESKVESVNIIGFQTDDQLLNSDYDEAAHAITSHDKWRGVGDASSNGTYLFRNGEFSLVQFDVDASYDGEVNPETVLDYNTAP